MCSPTSSRDYSQPSLRESHHSILSYNTTHTHTTSHVNTHHITCNTNHMLHHITFQYTPHHKSIYTHHTTSHVIPHHMYIHTSHVIPHHITCNITSQDGCGSLNKSKIDKEFISTDCIKLKLIRSISFMLHGKRNRYSSCDT